MCSGHCSCESEGSSFDTYPLIGEMVPDFELDIYQNESFVTKNLSDFKGKWSIFFFYPADFTFVCPTELEDMADQYAKFQELGAEVFSVSTDTRFVHKAWHDHSEAIKKIAYPMVADPAGELARYFGVYIPEGGDKGLALRGTFLVDPDGVLQACEVHANNIGRNATELVRKLEAAIFVREHGGEVCPAKWHPGAKTLKPGIDLVGKI